MPTVVCCHAFPGNQMRLLESEDLYSKQSPVSRFSDKSLELCTENLGSETGSDDVVVDNASPETCSPLTPEKSRCRAKARDEQGLNPCRGFPPPLTTMSGPNPMQVRRHREGGRLIIEAVEAPFKSSYLQVDRSEGRLRLCFFTGPDDEDDDGGGGVEEPTKEFEFGTEELDGEINLDRFPWLSRCKEKRHENLGLCNPWKRAFWVATS